MTKWKKVVEVLLSTVIVAVATVTLNWVVMAILEWPGRMGLGGWLLWLLGSVLFGLLTMGVYIIPSAFLISLAIAFLQRWSWKAVAVLLFVAVICSSVSSYLIDPTQSRSERGAEGYFARFDWFDSQFTLTAVSTGYIASLIAFWAVLKLRRRYVTRARSDPKA